MTGNKELTSHPTPVNSCHECRKKGLLEDPQGKDKHDYAPRRQDGWQIPATMIARTDESSAPAHDICPLTT